MSIKELIDFMLHRIRQSDSDARARVLRWLAQAELEVCAMAPWWFLRQMRPVTWVEGQKSYSFEHRVNDVVAIWNPDGSELDHINWATWRRHYERSAFGQPYPVGWTRRPPAGDANFITISVWPTPTGSVTAEAECMMGPEALADSEESYSKVPSPYVAVIALRGLELLAEEDEKVEMDQAISGDKDRMLQALLNENTRRLQRPGRW